MNSLDRRRLSPSQGYAEARVHERKIQSNVQTLQNLTHCASKQGCTVTVSTNDARCMIELRKQGKQVGSLLGATVDEALEQIRFAHWLIPILYPHADRTAGLKRG